ncbi:hypothetical protein SBOR_1444 [Sclerotinia borealis F-4128]|uniref:FAD-binding domain-containing protein n=1 Tax=Sclerotinia borealis (strain F-4128) TaxID=1432307 RepID=W9CUH2_SCLBF|nr:hypothetical protein SBOR_1444 [Sclerotinia borealis F-4128]
MISTTAPKLKVLILGAGIAGPCLAYWLCRTRLNTSIKVIEKSPVPRANGQAIDIHGAAVEITKKMKLEEEIRARSTTEKGTMMLSSFGKPIATFPAGDNFYFGLRDFEGRFIRALLEALRKFENVEYVYGDFVKTVEQKEGGVDVTFNGGSEDTFDLVVGADGATSKIDGAYILAGEVSKIQSSHDIPKALQRYEEVFRPVYKKMGNLPWGFHQIAMPQTRWGMRVRDSIIWFVGKTKIHRLLSNDQGGLIMSYRCING